MLAKALGSPGVISEDLESCNSKKGSRLIVAESS